MNYRRSMRITPHRVLAIATGAALLVPLAGPVQAANGQGTWAAWSESSTTSGSMSLTRFPSATVAVTDGSYSTAKSAYLNENTPIGAEFGSSSGATYAGVGMSTSSAIQSSTTVMTFTSPTPASGWAIALGDVDAESVRIAATGPNGAALDTSGWFASAFNYCITPKPGSCPAGTGTDVPTWDATTSTVVGSGTDTAGASAWLRPTAPVSTITLTQTKLIQGAPQFQMWIAADVRSVSYDANGGSGAPAPQTEAYGNTVALSTIVPTRPGYSFTGWNTAEDGSGTAYAPGASVTLTADLALYAQWANTPPPGGQCLANTPFGSTATITCVAAFTDPEDGVLAPTTVTGPSHGTATISDGVITYRPKPGFSGQDSMRIVVTDAAGATGVVTVTITVRPEEKPIVIPPGGGQIDIIDIAGTGGGSTIESVTSGQGTVSVDDNVVVFRPDPGFYGQGAVEAIVATPDGDTVSVYVDFHVGKKQKPKRPLGLPKKVASGSTVVLFDGRVRTNARQYARVRVNCTVKQPLASGEIRNCIVRRSRGVITVTTGSIPATLSVKLTAPAKGKFAPYWYERSWKVR